MPSDSRFNVVIVNPDQMRWDYATPYGHPFIDTRHLSRLAGMGTCFEQAFVSCPMCGPSRTSFLTGLYPAEHGVRDYGGTYSQDRDNALAVFGEAGYRRGLWGKDHCFEGDVFGRIYDEGENICLGIMGDNPHYINAWDSAELPLESPWNITKRLTDEGLAFIDRNAGGDTPFFLTINYQDPHPFFTCPEPWYSLFRPEQFELPANFRRGPVPGELKRLTNWRVHANETNMPEDALKRAMATYCGQIRYVDDQLGRVLDRLEERGILDRTIVVFWSDHGEFLGDFGVTHKMPAFFECLIRVPLVVWDPSGRLPRGKAGDLVEAMDVMATVLDLCGLRQPQGSRARSLLAHTKPRRDVFTEGGLLLDQPQEPVPGLRLKAAQPPTAFGPGAMIRTDTWKLSLFAQDVGQLFNIIDDPAENHNRFGDPTVAHIQSDLQTRLVQRLLCKGQAPEELPTGAIGGTS